MRINVTKGSSPLNLVKYLLDESKQREGFEPEINTNMFGRSAEELAEEFRFSHTLNPRVKQTMNHFSLSLSPGERVDSVTRHAISQRLLELTGHEDCQYLSAEHFDQSHKNDVQHWHVGTSNVDLDGEHIEDDFIRVKLRTIEKQLEQEFGLVQVENLPERDRRHIPTGEYRYKERTGITLPREKLWDQIQKYTADHPSMSVLAARLKANGIEVRFRERDDRITGISYEIDGFACSGWKLGKAYTFSGLQNHFGVAHSQSEDDELLQLQSKTLEECREYLAELEKPTPGTPAWNQAEFVLNYANLWLQKRKQNRADNDLYWAERDPQTGVVAVGRVGEKQAIAKGKPTESGWEISRAKVGLEDWQIFIERQRQQQELEQKKAISSRKQSQGFEIG